MFRTINKIVAVILLAYFALFIVPPVSSFASQQVYPGSEAEFNGSPVHHRQATQFLFDIIVWQQYKKTKQSEVTSAVHIGTPNLNWPARFSSLFLTVAAFSGFVITRSLECDRIPAPSHRVRSSYIIFLRSGCSPPALYFC